MHVVAYGRRLSECAFAAFPFWRKASLSVFFSVPCLPSILFSHTSPPSFLTSILYFQLSFIECLLEPVFLQVSFQYQRRRSWVTPASVGLVTWKRLGLSDFQHFQPPLASLRSLIYSAVHLDFRICQSHRHSLGLATSQSICSFHRLWSLSQTLQIRSSNKANMAARPETEERLARLQMVE